MKTSKLFLALCLIIGVLSVITMAQPRPEEWNVAPFTLDVKSAYLFGEYHCKESKCKSGDVFVADLSAFGTGIKFTQATLDVFLPTGELAMTGQLPVDIKDGIATFTLKYNEDKEYDNGVELDFLLGIFYDDISKDLAGEAKVVTLTYTHTGDEPVELNRVPWHVYKTGSLTSAFQLPYYKEDPTLHDFYFSLEATTTQANSFRIELLGPGSFQIYEDEGCQINDIEVDVEIVKDTNDKVLFIDVGETIPVGTFIVTDCLRIRVKTPTEASAGLPYNVSILLNMGQPQDSITESAVVIPARFLPEDHVPDLTTNMFIDSNNLSCYFGIRFSSNEVVNEDDYVNLTILGVKNIDKKEALIRVGTESEVYTSTTVANDKGVYSKIPIKVSEEDKKTDKMFGVVFHIPIDLEKYTDKDDITCRFTYSHVLSKGSTDRASFQDSMTDIRYLDIAEEAKFVHTPVTPTELTFEYSFEKTAVPYSSFIFNTPLLDFIYKGDFKTCTLNDKPVRARNDQDGKEEGDFVTTFRIIPDDDIPAQSNVVIKCSGVKLYLPTTQKDDPRLKQLQLVTVFANGYTMDGEEKDEDQWVTSRYFNPDGSEKKDDDDDSGKKLIIYIVIGVVAVAVIAVIAFFLIRRRKASDPADMGVGLLDDVA